MARTLEITAFTPKLSSTTICSLHPKSQTTLMLKAATLVPPAIRKGAD
jgi:hypothetical protein